MSSSEDEINLPVAESDVRREVSAVIARDGVHNLKSKAVREHLKNTFNVDFTAYKSQVDDVIKSCIIGLHSKKPEPKEEQEEKEVEYEKTDSDSDSDPGVDHSLSTPARKRKSVAAPKPASTPVVLESPENEDLHSAVKRRRAATKTVERKVVAKKEPGVKKRKATNLGRFGRVQYCSDELMAITGQRYMPRSDVVKAVWDYIKTNDCYDKKNRQFAVCDDVLKPIFKRAKFKPFGMMKHLCDGRHLIKPEDISVECVEEAKEVERAILAERNAIRQLENEAIDARENGEEEKKVVKEEEDDGEDDDEGGDGEDGEDSD